MKVLLSKNIKNQKIYINTAKNINNNIKGKDNKRIQLIKVILLIMLDLRKSKEKTITFPKLYKWIKINY